MESKLVSEHDILLALDSLEAVMPVDCKRAFKAMRRAITVLPAADVAPVKRGEWVEREAQHEDSEETSTAYYMACSQCGACRSAGMGLANFCPNCGAKMR